MPWLIRDSKFNKKHTFELTENIDVFSTILSSCGLNFNNKNMNSNLLPLTVGGIDDWISFSQSIFFRYKLTKLLLIRRIPYYFESEKKSSDDGFLDLNIKFDEKLSNITDQIDFSFTKKVQDQMNIWNNALKKNTFNMKIFLKSKFNFFFNKYVSTSIENLKVSMETIDAYLTRINF